MSAMTGTSAQRLSLIPLASRVLAELLRRLEPKRVAVSAYGLREGLLYRQMPEPMRLLDPLIEACRHTEAASARNPGFGDALYQWLLPLYPGRPEADLRLILAACLLHDVNWRAHPDYRAELCFESVTRANVAGINHRDRVFLGLALLNRYKAVAPVEEVGATAGCCRRSAPPRRRCSAGRCGSGRCCRDRRPACSSILRIGRNERGGSCSNCAVRRASSPARRSNDGFRRWRSDWTVRGRSCSPS